jgi:hypothetical protein
MLRMLTLLASAVVASSVLAMLVAYAQAAVFGACDPKLGCSGGVTVAATFAAIVTLGVGLCLILFARAAMAFRERKEPPSHALPVAVALAIGAALWVTSHGWL